MMDPPSQQLFRWFSYEHLKDERLESVSRRFSVLASDVIEDVPPGPERTVCLRKLLEAKDAAVRATIAGRDDKTPVPQ